MDKTSQGGEQVKQQDGFMAMAASGNGSICGYDSLHHLLKENLKPHHFQEVNRLLTGLNCGKPLQTIALPESVTALSNEYGFDLQAFRFHADKELLREPRLVRVGLIQNSIALPTTAHFSDQKKAIFDKLKPIIDAAGSSGVNIRLVEIVKQQAYCNLKDLKPFEPTPPQMRTLATMSCAAAPDQGLQQFNFPIAQQDPFIDNFTGIGTLA